MSTIDPSIRRRPQRRRRRWPRAVATLAGVVVLLLAGYGVGRAVDDNPEPGPAVTTIRTIQPLPAVATTTG